jgi:hypothetical protein
MSEELARRVEALETRLKVLEDKQEIHEALMRYCRGVDRADAELISSAFHPDAISDHGLAVFSGSDIGETLAAIEHRVKTSTHFVGNELIELDGDVACSEAYFISVSEIERDGEPFMIWRGARYVDRWERRDGEWRIAYRIVPGEWNRVDPIHERIPNADKLHAGSHSRDDPVYRIRTAAVGSLGRERDVDDADAAAAFVRALEASGFEPADTRTP